MVASLSCSQVWASLRAAARAQAPTAPPYRPQPSIRCHRGSHRHREAGSRRHRYRRGTEAQTAQAAAAQNATKLDAVLRAVKTAAGAAAESRPTSYSLDPNYRYPKPGGQPELAGYTARNSIQVTTAELDSAGRIIDAATRSGANSIERLQFTLKDDLSARVQALPRGRGQSPRGRRRDGLRARREDPARALGRRGRRGSRRPAPCSRWRAWPNRSPAPPTPVAPGTIEVHARVVLTVEIAQ